jgi:hypothetical protein
MTRRTASSSPVTESGPATAASCALTGGSRECYRAAVAGRKSDHGDAVVLANVLRTDLHAHRPLSADSELAQAIAVLARAQQDAVWDRTAAHNKLRSHLREYFPGFLTAFAAAKGGIAEPEE